MRHRPSSKEDAKNLSIVTGSGILAALLTSALVGSQGHTALEPIVVRRVAEPLVVEIVELVEPEPTVIVTRLTGSNRLYGTVRTTSGSEVTGYIRWDQNDASWTDLLSATKPRARGGSSISGIRFGHVDRVEVLGRNLARFTLKSGDQVELAATATDLGTGLRALFVEEGNGHVAEFEWRDLEEIDFGEPSALQPSKSRLFGTLTTRSGMAFTGYVTWDVDEIYTSDVLDGDLDGERQEIPFGAIASIERLGSWASRVTLQDGTEMILEGTSDVDHSLRGISISDAGLGQVKLGWNEFQSLRFHGTDDEAAFTHFDGGAPIQGTVVTERGEELSGSIVWDDDEAYTWEMLNGELGDVEFNVEFGLIARIAKLGDGVEVALLDGRTFELSNSNDVDDGNRGILIHTARGTYEVDWDDFAELRLTREAASTTAGAAPHQE